MSSHFTAETERCLQYRFQKLLISKLMLLGLSKTEPRPIMSRLKPVAWPKKLVTVTHALTVTQHFCSVVFPKKWRQRLRYELSGVRQEKMVRVRVSFFMKAYMAVSGYHPLPSCVLLLHMLLQPACKWLQFFLLPGNQVWKYLLLFVDFSVFTSWLFFSFWWLTWWYRPSLSGSSGSLGSFNYNSHSWVGGLEFSKICPRNRL